MSEMDRCLLLGATRRMLQLKMCTIMLALRAGLCVRVVPE